MKAPFRAFSDWLASPAAMARLFPPASPRRTIELDACRRILVLKLDEIGDFVLATPFLRELRRNAPRARITLVVKPAVLNLAETCPHADEVIVYDGQTRGRRFWQLRRQWRALDLSRRRLRHPQADLAVIPRWGEDAYNATNLAVMARPRAVLAWSESATAVKSAMNRGVDALVSHPVAPQAPCHEVEHNLALLAAAGGSVQTTALEVWPTADDHACARSLLTGSGRRAAFAPGALDPLRRWPLDNFAMLAGWLCETQGLAPVVLGSAADPVIPGTLDLRGRTTLRQAAAVLAQCMLFVGNDSGLKHLAAAVGMPVVEISAFRAGGDPNHGNSPARFHPWGVPHRVLQPPAGPGVLAVEEVAVPAVQAACTELLQTHPA